MPQLPHIKSPGVVAWPTRPSPNPKDSTQLKGVRNRSVYDRRLDLYKMIELMDPRINRKTLMRSRIRITVEAYPFTPSGLPVDRTS